MLTKILGWFWIIMGIIFLIRPEMLKNKLLKKSKKILKKYLFFITISLGFLLIAAAWNYQGILPKVVMVFGIIAILKAFFILKLKAMDKIIDWWTKQPLIFFRLSASIYIILGLIILNIRK